MFLTICTCMSVGNSSVDLWYQPNISKIAEVAITGQGTQDVNADHKLQPNISHGSEEIVEMSTSSEVPLCKVCIDSYVLNFYYSQSSWRISSFDFLGALFLIVWTMNQRRRMRYSEVIDVWGCRVHSKLLRSSWIAFFPFFVTRGSLRCPFWTNRRAI